MKRVKFMAVGAIALAALLAAPGAQAQDFTLSQSVAGGTFTLKDSSSVYPVTELVVSGAGATAGTTRPGWSATAFLFSDPLNCLPALNTSLVSGFCYLLTNPGAGTGVLNGSETVTYDASLDDQTVPSDFAVLFTGSNGVSGGCFGTSGGGCSAIVPEPPMGGAFLAGLLGLLTIHAMRRAGAVARV